MTALGLLAALPVPSAARRPSASLQVSATVLPYARIETETHPPALEVTETDVARGFIDVTGVTTLTVRTNHTSYAIEFRTEGPLEVIAVGVGGLGDECVFGPLGRIRRTVAGPSLGTLRPRWRFYLGEAVRPGTYPWPLRVSASARGVPDARDGATVARNPPRK